jgi:hypothetical protein
MFRPDLPGKFRQITQGKEDVLRIRKKKLQIIPVLARFFLLLFSLFPGNTFYHEALLKFVPNYKFSTKVRTKK